MTDDNDAGKAEGKTRAPGAAPRLWGKARARGFFSASDYAKGAVRKAGSSRGFAETRLLTRWAEIAGADAAEICRPVKVSYARGGMGATLIVWCEGARAPEVEMLKPRLIERVNAAYGYNAVSRIHISQSEKPPERHAGPAAPHLRPLTAREEAQVEDAVAGIADPGLREALRRLGQNVKSRVARPASPAPADTSNPNAPSGPKAPPARPQS